jgi:hypothetical protein
MHATGNRSRPCRIASTTLRSLVLRGLPIFDGGDSNGSISAHSSFVRSLA